MTKTIIKSIQEKEALLQNAIEINLDMDEFDKIARQLEDSVIQLAKEIPASFNEAIDQLKCFLRLIENTHDDVNLVKNYARIVISKLNYLEKFNDFTVGNQGV